MKRIAILGSTGSIGTQALEVITWQGWRVSALAAGTNAALLLEQAHRYRPAVVSVAPSIADEVAPHLPAGTTLVTNAENVATAPDTDIVLSAIPGLAGLAPTRAALELGRTVALANKESLVVAGPLMTALATERGGHIFPVDSEHSALWQCMVGEDPTEVASLILTASGGPFIDGPADLSAVTPEQALAHPNWDMGRKVSIDSATLFNKGLEVLEAHFLYNIPLSAIEVVVHRQSFVHSMVRFTDGVIKAHVGAPDMRLPILYALAGGTRPETPLPPFDVTGSWDFQHPDLARFPALQTAYRAGELGGVVPTWLNAADEVAVEAFLAGRIPFTAISAIVEAATNTAPVGVPLTWESIADADRAARVFAHEATLHLKEG